MRIVTSAAAMQRLALQWRRRGIRIGFVPTMGCLHTGHLSLVKEARQAVRAAGRVVLSIYVNPAQFGPKEDFAKYPRPLARDTQLCRETGVDVLFAPADREIYPRSDRESFSTFVVEEKLSQSMEGAARPTHFRGVTTVVAKLFNLVLPDVAVFGAKDWQQAAIVQKMTRDLNFPVKVRVAPTLREPDGLAMSSRNQYLSPEERPQATALARALGLAAKQVQASRHPLAAAKLKTQMAAFIHEQPAARVDYIEFFDPVTLEPVASVQRGTHVALAVFVGKTRLIDNASL